MADIRSHFFLFTGGFYDGLAFLSLNICRATEFVQIRPYVLPQYHDFMNLNSCKVFQDPTIIQLSKSEAGYFIDQFNEASEYYSECTLNNSEQTPIRSPNTITGPMVPVCTGK